MNSEQLSPTQELNLILDDLYAAEDYNDTLSAMDRIHAFVAVPTNRTSSVLAKLKLAEITID